MRTADVLLHLRRYEEALLVLRQLLDVSADSPRGHCKMGQALFELGRYPESIDSFQAALQTAPFMIEASLGLGKACLKVGRRSDGVRRLRDVVRIHPDHPEATRILRDLGEGIEPS
jgi:tetratricopeptide (TPR) repeat protein